VNQSANIVMLLVSNHLCKLYIIYEAILSFSVCAVLIAFELDV